MNPKNPFLTAGYHSPDYFCDRERETADLIAAVNNDRNVTLVAPRRMGKSGLVKNVFYHLAQQGEYKCAYVDLRAASSVAAALKSLGDADLVYRSERGYEVYDRLFGIWLSRLP